MQAGREEEIEELALLDFMTLQEKKNIHHLADALDLREDQSQGSLRRRLERATDPGQEETGRV